LKFDDFEADTYYEHVSNLPGESSHVLAAVDITNALDTASGIAADQYACLFCKGPLVYHIFKECPSLANFMREGTAYVEVKMDPRWILDSQDLAPKEAHFCPERIAFQAECPQAQSVEDKIAVEDFACPSGDCGTQVGPPAHAHGRAT